MVTNAPDSAQKLLADARTARSEDRSRDAKRQVMSALELIGSIDSELYAEAIGVLGQIERDLGNITASITCYQQATDIYRRGQNRLRLAHTLRHLGDLHFLLNQRSRADKCYREAMTIYRHHPRSNQLDVANMLRSYAIFKENQGSNLPAISLWMEAKTLYESCGVKAGVIECENKLKTLSE